MKYFGVYKDILKYQFEELKKENIEIINKDKYILIIQLSTYSKNNGNWGNTYDVYDINMEPTAIEINGWKTESKFSTYADWSNVKSHVTINISDIKGVIKKVTVLNSLDEIFKFVSDTSTYYTWEYYDTLIENKNLKTEIAKLEEEKDELKETLKKVKLLETENDQLKETLDNCKVIEDENIKLKNKFTQILDVLFELKQDNTNN
jgi:hypothetical protein